MARPAENLRQALPLPSAPTLLVYGDQDIGAPLAVANALNSADEFDATVRAFLHEHGA
ncbi:hypothetical protein LFT45_05975 [Arthrobacter sp. FW305-BF8]|uniref:hypothetical protein n=1 Tax=Arthrobacter sp. FW305-BF8 TaxID=2879617 RepID=UPI001F27FF45|nr:hypothetical protein [Arthrobacter sp. FW305-BF8]UKA55469.1 hypothetical protein LFT45_05975 [Arthrobacter sp. FW305-BF8]